MDCTIGKGVTEPIILPQIGVGSLTMECVVKNIVDDPITGPAYPPPTYKWKKDNNTIIQNEELTESFYMLYPDIRNIDPLPVKVIGMSTIMVDFDNYSVSQGMNIITLPCKDHVVQATIDIYILYSILGTWTCEVENGLGSDVGSPNHKRRRQV